MYIMIQRGAARDERGTPIRRAHEHQEVSQPNPSVLWWTRIPALLPTLGIDQMTSAQQSGAGIGTEVRGPAIRALNSDFSPAATCSLSPHSRRWTYITNRGEQIRTKFVTLAGLIVVSQPTHR